MNVCPNCNGRSLAILKESGQKKCTTCSTIFTEAGKVVEEGKSFLSEVNPQSQVF